jgi:hypothetical protein
MALVGYLGGTTLYFALRILAAWVRAEPGPARSLLASVFLCAVVSPVFIFSDSADLAGLNWPRLGSVPILLLLYFGAYSLHAVARWRVRNAIRDLLIAVAVISGAVGVVAFVHPLEPDEYAGIATVLVVCFMLMQPPRLAAVQQRARRTDLLFERIARLPTKSLAGLMHALAQWPELTSLQIIEDTNLTEAEQRRADRYFAAHGSVARRPALVRERLYTQDPENLLAIEQLLYLMNSYQVDYLARIQGNAFVGASFQVGLEEQVYAGLLTVVVHLARLVAEKDGVVGDR